MVVTTGLYRRCCENISINSKFLCNYVNEKVKAISDLDQKLWMFKASKPSRSPKSVFHTVRQRQGVGLRCHRPAFQQSDIQTPMLQFRHRWCHPCRYGGNTNMHRTRSLYVVRCPSIFSIFSTSLFGRVVFLSFFRHILTQFLRSRYL
jgi:hypothetical protein